MRVVCPSLLLKELRQAAEYIILQCSRIGELDLLDSVDSPGQDWMVIIFIFREELGDSVDFPGYGWLVFREELVARKVRLT